MEFLGLGLLGVGWLIAFIFGIILLIESFKTSILWGLGYVFVPFVSLVFVIVHWDRAKQPFLRSLLSLPFLVLGAIIMASYGADQIPM